MQVWTDGLIAIGAAGRWNDRSLTVCDAHEIGQAFDRSYVVGADERRLSTIRRWHHQRSSTVADSSLCNRERAMNRPNATVERKFSNERCLAKQGRLDLAACGKNRRGDCEIERRSRLLQVRRSEVRGDPPLRKLEPLVQQRRAHAFTRFSYGCVRQSDDRECREAAADVNFDGDRAGVDSLDRICRRFGEHGKQNADERVTRQDRFRRIL